MLGVLFAALSAASFALNNAGTRRGVLTGTVSQAMAITVPIGMPFFLLALVASGNWDKLVNFPPDGIRMMALVGVLHFICGRYCNYRAVKAIGANLSAPIVQMYLVFTVGLAIAILGEKLTALRIAGIVLVVLGPTLMRHPDAAPAEGPPDKERADAAPPRDGLPIFRPQFAEGYFFAALAACCYGATPIMLRSVVEREGIGGSLAAALIAFSAASVVIALMLLWPGQWRHVLAMDRRSVKWFGWSAAFVCFSQMFLYMALAVAPVSVVMPVLQLSLVFRYGLARLLNPHHEIFGGKVIAGTLASLAGAVALSVSSEAIASTISLPVWLHALLLWQWP